MPSFLAELQRRHVYKVGAMYAVAGWLLVQVATQVFPFFDVPNAAVRVVVIAVMLGFPVTLALAWLFDLTPDGIVLTETLPHEGEPPNVIHARRSVDRKLNYVLGGLLLLAVGYVAADRVVRGKAPPVVPTAQFQDQEKSIAVLPFESLSEDKANAYFAIGIQDEILTRLAKIGALKVISRTSTAHYASAPEDLREIARQLGVANILEGSVQKAGDTVHINVQLIRAATDEHLWAESYTRTLNDVFGVEGEVAGVVAAQLNATLTGAEQQALAKKPTENAAAYDAYLRGIALQTVIDRSRAHYQSVIDLFQQAVAADPNFAEAWARLSREQLTLWGEYNHVPEQLKVAKDSVDTALRLQPESPEAWLQMARYRLEMNDDGAAAEALEHVRKQTPNDVELFEALAQIEDDQNHPEGALAYRQNAVQLDPRDSRTWAQLGNNLRLLGRFDDARSAYQHALDLLPGNATLVARIARIYLAEGRTQDAATVLVGIHLDPQQYETGEAFDELWRQQRAYEKGIAEWTTALAGEDAWAGEDVIPAHMSRGYLALCAGNRALALSDFGLAKTRIEALKASGQSFPIMPIFLGVSYAVLGEREAALKFGNQGLEETDDDTEAVLDMARTEMLVGDKASAIASLEKSLRQPGGVTVPQLRLDCLWDPLRGESGFQKLIQNDAAAPGK